MKGGDSEKGGERKGVSNTLGFLSQGGSAEVRGRSKVKRFFG